ncbi:UNVERIFIED_CONTAM: putative mitochondrial protein [Sesamum latifolium]|uniref:Mitochondrial protein n=1 Tax=Sesamum latifolium TaxID=2727402 RepID=A0AAW2SRK9_9LAMI
MALEDDEGIRCCIETYFKGVFTSSRPQAADIARGTAHLKCIVDSSMADELTLQYTEVEVTKAVFQMASLKSPGPDGMPPIFFQSFWHIVKNDVIACVLNFLNSLNLPSGFNDTHITLIPKCKQPEFLHHFHPISLCNIMYKIASKAIANRLKLHLDKIISPAQSAFVPSWLITDNILLAFELNHFLNTKANGNQGYMALKLDISKAYDKVEWAFLEQVLSNLGFPSPFIRLVMFCVSSVSYTFLLGGKQFGSVIPERGLRQGDPLSPYLFLLCTESFSTLLQKAEVDGRIRGVSVCRGAPSVSHLLFADNTLIFSRASGECARSILVLDVYRRASGQEINFAKSSVAFIKNTQEDICQLIAGLLNIRRENKMELYLGLPSKVARSKRELFAVIRDKVWQRITGWNEKFLSQAGKEVLIKSVIQAIPTYAMGCFKLPITLLREIQGMIARFWWSNREQAVDGGSVQGIRFAFGKIRGSPVLSPLNRLLPPPTASTVHTVADLIDSGYGDWDGDKIGALFWPIDRDIILSISISRAGDEDIIIWHFSNNGIFSVRSAYHLACDLNDEASGSNLKAEQTWWKSIWQAKLPDQVACFATSYYEAFLIQNSEAAVSRVQGGPSRWIGPPSGFVKLNFDGAILDKGTAMGIGVVARDERGRCIGWLSRRIDVMVSGEMAEAWAAREATQLALRRGWPMVVIEGDCLVLISKIRNATQDFSPVGPVISDIHKSASALSSCNFNFVKRSYNSVAHCLAKSANVASLEGDDLPLATLNLVNNELLS